MRNIERLLIAYVILKPFYLFSSGNLQISDICIILAMIFYIILLKFDLKSRNSLKTILKSNLLLFIFVTATFIINISYYAIYGDSKFLLSSIYFVFTSIAVIMFSIFAQSKLFLSKLTTAFKFNLIIQLAIYILGMGEYYSPDRYMATFNDPNQFAFFIFLSYLFIYVLKILLRDSRSTLTYFIIATILVLASASTGMLLGLFVFVALQTLYNLFNFKLRFNTARKIAYVFTAAGITLILFLIMAPKSFNYDDGSTIKKGIEESSIGDRLQEKTAKAGGESELTLWEDRGYDKIFKYPEKILLGAGEGSYERFTESATVGELHMTLPSILFYYGIIPLIIILRWIYAKVKNADPRILIALISLIIESFTLLNQRQSLFWILILISGLQLRKVTSEKYNYQNV